MNNIYTLNKFRKAKSSTSKTFQLMTEKVHEDAKRGETKSVLPIYKNDIDAVFSQALIRRLGGVPGDCS